MRAEGLSFPSRANSTVLYISEHNGASTADIMRELHQPHQLVAQRIDLLMELGVVERLDDPNDKRRKILRLTRKGKKEAALLRNAMKDAIRAFERLFDEIDVEMDEAVRSMTKALADASIGERVKAVRTRKRRAA